MESADYWERQRETQVPVGMERGREWDGVADGVVLSWVE